MIEEAELFIALPEQLELDAGALARLSSLFSFTSRLDMRRRARLAAALERILDALRACGLDDAVYAAHDGWPCFIVLSD